MRISALFLRLGVFVVAGLISVLAARATVAVVEDRSVVSVQQELIDQGYEWAAVQGDGLQVILEGQASTEAAKFRATCEKLEAQMPDTAALAGILQKAIAGCPTSAARCVYRRR